MEMEENREIPFLDVCIKRDHNTFSTTVHHEDFSLVFTPSGTPLQGCALGKFSGAHYK